MNTSVPRGQLLESESKRLTNRGEGIMMMRLG